MSKRRAKTRDERVQEASRLRRDQEKEDLRQLIVKAAGELFLKKGYQRFSLRQVAEDIGYSPGTIYLHFDNKDDLLFSVVNKGFEEFTDQLRQAFEAHEDPIARLVAIGNAYVDFGLQNPAYYRLMFTERPDFLLQLAGDTPESWLESFTVWQRAVEAAMEAGLIREGNVIAICDVLWAMLHGIVAFAGNMPFFDEQRVQNAFESATAVLFHGLIK